MASKQEFIAAYAAKLQMLYPWASDPARLERFMSSVAGTLAGGNTWNRSGEAYVMALKACGLPTRMTLKALQALPD